MYFPPQQLLPQQQQLHQQQQAYPTTIPVFTRRPQAPPPTNPTQTLYVRNLNESINHKRLSKGVDSLFSLYKPLDIKIKRNIKHRGQCFISFSSQEVADKAKSELHNQLLFGKPLDIQYARDESFAISQLKGTLESHKRKREEIKNSRVKTEQQPSKKAKPAEKVDENVVPNAILFIQNLPKETTREVLSGLFSQFPGFQEIRTVPGKPDIAFVEYDSETLSAVAKKALHGYRITPEKEIKVSFAKK